MSSPGITPTPRPEIASESGSSVLAAIYRRAIERHEEMQKAAHPGGPDDAERRSNEIRATTDYTE